MKFHRDLTDEEVQDVLNTLAVLPDLPISDELIEYELSLVRARIRISQN